MPFHSTTLVSSAILILALLAPRSTAAEDALAKREWSVGGVTRDALVHLPPDSNPPAPLVFVFHGHGGNGRQAARSFRIHELWPEAVVVYPQGLNTPGRLSDPEGKRPGWQHSRGQLDDRDLKFFDAILASLREEKRVDDARVYVTGHSNGGAFTYLLWAERGDAITAVAPSGGLDRASVQRLKPKPVLHVAGMKDPLVKFEWQAKMVDAVRAINGCGRDGKKHGERVTTYESPGGTPVVTYYYDGGHGYPREASAEIVKFFKSQPAKPTTRP